MKNVREEIARQVRLKSVNHWPIHRDKISINVWIDMMEYSPYALSLRLLIEEDTKSQMK